MPEHAKQIRREDLRRAVRGYLFDRMGTALSIRSITRGLKREWDASEAEVKASISYLSSKEPAQVDSAPDEDGATCYYRITAAGTNAHERQNG